MSGTHVHSSDCVGVCVCVCVYVCMCHNEDGEWVSSHTSSPTCALALAGALALWNVVLTQLHRRGGELAHLLGEFLVQCRLWIVLVWGDQVLLDVELLHKGVELLQARQRRRHTHTHTHTRSEDVVEARVPTQTLHSFASTTTAHAPRHSQHLREP
jgi:hypothetical protein